MACWCWGEVCHYNSGWGQQSFTLSLDIQFLTLVREKPMLGFNIPLFSFDWEIQLIAAHCIFVSYFVDCCFAQERNEFLCRSKYI